MKAWKKNLLGKHPSVFFLNLQPTMRPCYLLILLLILGACGGSIPEEQRRQLREKMEANKIVRVTEVEITEAAFEEGRRIMMVLDSLRSDSSGLNSFLNNYKGKIRFLRPGESRLHELEKQLLEAYQSDPSGSGQENVQNVRNDTGGFDSLLYTKPVNKKLSNGTVAFEGVWSIWLAKKQLVSDIGRRQ